MPADFREALDRLDAMQAEYPRMKDEPADDLAAARGILHALMIEGLVACLIFAGAFYALS
jgi:hypothetical protein